MQRSRRRKLRREASRDPFLLQVKRGRDYLRHRAYGVLNRAARRSLIAQHKKEK